MLGYGPNTGPDYVSPKETLSTFGMGGLREIQYASPGVRTPPPKEHIHRHPHFKKYKYQMFGLRDYSEYTDKWLIGYEQRSIDDFLHRQRQFYNTLTIREIQILQTYTLYGDRLLNNFLRQTDKDIESLITAMLSHDTETPLDYQIVDNYARLESVGLKLPPYDDLFIRDKDFDQMKKHANLSESARRTFVGQINRAKCRQVVSYNTDWFVNFENIKPMIYALFTEIMDIILRAPRPTAPMKVYRGSGSEHQKSLTFTALDFWSTSISPDAALEFVRGVTGDTSTMCCIHEITINPGVPCMFLDPISKIEGEMEILMVPSTIYKSGRVVRKKAIYPLIGDTPLYVYTTELTATDVDPVSVSYKYLERHWAARRARAAKRAHRRYKFTMTGNLDPKSARRMTMGRRRSKRRSTERRRRSGKRYDSRSSSNRNNRYIPVLELHKESEEDTE